MELLCNQPSCRVKSSMVLELDNLVQLNCFFTMDNCTNALQQGIPIDLIYLDFSKVFDSVPHQTLLGKIRA